MKEVRYGEVGLQRCAVKFCEQKIVVGGLISGTKDVFLELCQHHAEQFVDKNKILERKSE